MSHPAQEERINTGEIVARFLQAQGVRLAFGVISIHNMPMLDAFHRLGKIRFVPARGEAGAANMADAAARVSNTLSVVVTSTGTGAGNAAGALVEAMTAGTPLLHLTGQIDSEWIDKNWGFMHEHPDQQGMLRAVGKAAFRINSPQEAWEVLTRATRLALTPPCGPVSVEIAIDVQQAFLDENVHFPGVESAQSAPVLIASKQPDPAHIAQLAKSLQGAQRPLLWLGGGARNAGAAVQRLVDLGFGVVTSVQGRGVMAEDHPASLGAFNLQRASAQLYQRCDAMLIVGSRLRSNETMKYKLALPARRFRIDANPKVQTHAYACEQFIEADADLALHALADALQDWRAESSWHEEIFTAKQGAQQQVDAAVGAYVQLKNALNHTVTHELQGQCIWVRDITLSNTMWGNRSPVLRHPRAGVHALGGGIGQGLQMGVGAALAADIYKEKQAVAGVGSARSAMKTIVLVGDGGFMLNVGELACAAQERADILVILMNDGGYGVIKNIQDVDYGSRHCYVDLHTPDFAQLCASMGVRHLKSTEPAQIQTQLTAALQGRGPTVLEIDMHAWGPFTEKFAGPPRKL
ncbi:thiamine pyrophosphate-binding protein [Variovorax sp. PCZ-1]|uniref:thiamine pyrophosphate-binding protein n=1 Tax=Variovorax sp. PCZ-1 TaxID=2835533 RepID=UPI001BCEB0CF|nr:thiamine pyrophosphate-binding protein [Variovorax sp. PCZ-1]MBS7808805.1 thiamine pyrophosphate-binding protein [Variovorax sp. PCZ-1]